MFDIVKNRKIPSDATAELKEILDWLREHDRYCTSLVAELDVDVEYRKRFLSSLQESIDKGRKVIATASLGATPENSSPWLSPNSSAGSTRLQAIPLSGSGRFEEATRFYAENMSNTSRAQMASALSNQQPNQPALPLPNKTNNLVVLPSKNYLKKKTGTAQ